MNYHELCEFSIRKLKCVHLKEQVDRQRGSRVEGDDILITYKDMAQIDAHA